MNPHSPATVSSNSVALRHWLVLALFIAGAVVLAGRGLVLQLYHRDFLQQQGDNRHLRQQPILAYRGRILDRNGEPLAVSTPVDSIWVHPQKFLLQRSRWPEIAHVLGIDVDAIAQLMQAREKRKFVFLKRHIYPSAAVAVDALRIPGVYKRTEFRRYYPMGQAAGHLLGFTNVDDRGQEGIELAYDSRLRGTDGARRVVRDRVGNAVEGLGLIRAANPGKDIVLSLDRRIQHIAYSALRSSVRQHRAHGGSIVVLDVNSAEVLAMVNQPSFNPNKRSGRYGHWYRNRAVTDVFEPGSTIKPFTIAVGLVSGVVQPDTLIDTTPGTLRIGKYTIRDVRNFGEIDVTSVIRKSSNVGAAKIGLSISAPALWDMFTALGVGQTTGSGFPGEVAGVINDPARWRDVHRATLSFGYGMSMTALQLARAYSVLATRGVLREVTLLRRDNPAPGRRVLDAKVAEQVMAMLEVAVDTGGTGTRSVVDGFRIGGKTGTVRKIEQGRYVRRYQSMFVGMAPMSSPRLVVVVVIDEPRNGQYYGGQVAAPVFAEVMSGGLRMLGLAPDDPDSDSDVSPMRLAGNTVERSDSMAKPDR